MQPEHLIAFNITLLAAMASPGPALVVAIRTVLSAGGRAGMAIGCGLPSSPPAGHSPRWSGWMPFQAVPLVLHAGEDRWRAVSELSGIRDLEGGTAACCRAVIPAGHAFRSGILVNLSNPKSVLFAAAVLVAIFPPDMDIAHKLAIVGNHLGIEIVFYTMLAATMSRQAVRTRYFAMKLYLDRFAAAVLQVLAVNILFSLW